MQYQELFAICQALPGPGSTKMAFCIAIIHTGMLPAILAFLIWSLPGALGMFALALGVQRINEVLPDPVYALLSGLNASTVGIIALAAVQLAEKAIKDRLTRMLVVLGACAGLCYNALWYFPLLMTIGGVITVVWDLWMRARVGKIKASFERRRHNEQREEEERTEAPSSPVQLEERIPEASGAQRRSTASGRSIAAIPVQSASINGSKDRITAEDTTPATIDMVSHAIPVKLGLALILGFFATFTAFLVVRGVLPAPPLALDLFTNMYLAGTIIFGGGPVVIPLLREYVVQPGWVSSRDFLIGLAIIQAFPGPNFNFAVYLGALTLTKSSAPLGAFLAFIGIFVPGLTLAVGIQNIWRVIRSKPAVTSLLRGVNATAVGLVFTAVYRLWEIGFLTAGAGNDGVVSLGRDPWWVVVAAVSYSVTAWWGVPPAVAIVGGAVGGLVWYGVVGV